MNMEIATSGKLRVTTSQSFGQPITTIINLPLIH